MRLRPVLFLMAVAVCGRGAEPPEAVISNPQIRVKIYLPDVENGFYQGARFDWSGMIGSVDFAGHRFYGPWFAKVDSTVRDVSYKDSDILVSPATGAVGPAEEFQMPQGFSTAKPGETFVKIGVGTLEKNEDNQYAFSKVY